MADGSQPAYARRRAKALPYLLDDGQVYTASEVHALLPHLSYQCVLKRLRRGERRLAELGKPPLRVTTKLPPDQCPMHSVDRKAWEQAQADRPYTLALRAWRYTGHSRALTLLRLHYDPLRARL
jgi:hypothetical protein